MSDEKKSRTLDEVRQEYTNLCSKAGNLQYQIAMLEADLSLINETLKSLNLEAAKVNQDEQEAKKAAEASNVTSINQKKE